MNAHSYNGSRCYVFEQVLDSSNSVSEKFSESNIPKQQLVSETEIVYERFSVCHNSRKQRYRCVVKNGKKIYTNIVIVPIIYVLEQK